VKQEKEREREKMKKKKKNITDLKIVHKEA